MTSIRDMSMKNTIHDISQKFIVNVNFYQENAYNMVCDSTPRLWV